MFKYAYGRVRVVGVHVRTACSESHVRFSGPTCTRVMVSGCPRGMSGDKTRVVQSGPSDAIRVLATRGRAIAKETARLCDRIVRMGSVEISSNFGKIRKRSGDFEKSRSLHGNVDRRTSVQISGGGLTFLI